MSIFWTRQIGFKAPCTIWTRRRNMLLYFNAIFDASCTFSIDASKMTLNYSSILPRRFENVQDASSKYATIFQCNFGGVMQIFDASNMTFVTPPPE